MHILTQICELQKNGMDEPNCRNRDSDVENVGMETYGGGVGDEWTGQDYTLPYTRQRVGTCWIVQGTRYSAL